MAEYFLTIQEPLILQRKPILPSPHPACLLSEGELMRREESFLTREHSGSFVLERNEKDKKLSLSIKEGKRKNITQQIKITEQDQSVP